MVVSWIILAMLVAIGLAIIFGIVFLASILSSERGRTFLKVLLIVPVLVLVVVPVLAMVAGVVAPSLRFRHDRMAQYAHAEAEQVRQSLEESRAAMEIRMDEALKRGEEARQAGRQARDSGRAVHAAAAGHVKQAIEEATEATSAENASTADEIAAVDVDDAVSGTEPAAAASNPEPEPDPAEETPAAAEALPAKELPSWVGAAPHKVDGVYRMSISTDPYATRADCDRELPNLLHAAVQEYATEYLGRQARVHVRLPLDDIQSQIVKEEFAEEKQIRISPEGKIPEEHATVTLVHVLLEFDGADNARIEAAWDEVVVAERLAGLGVLTTLLLALLCTAYGYLKSDLATGGAYRGRLRLAAAAVVVALVVAGLMLSLA